MLCRKELLLCPQQCGVQIWVLAPHHACTYHSAFLHGCELWSPTKMELTMLERTHRKILRTITGLPLRCNNNALLLMMGIPNIAAMIQQRQISFLHSLSTLPTSTLPRLVMSAQSTIIIKEVIQTNHLPTIDSILEGEWSKLSWKRFVKELFLAARRLNNFRIRLLVGCHGLEANVCRFTSSVSRDPT
jgi:hypothetical protein